MDFVISGVSIVLCRITLFKQTKGPSIVLKSPDCTHTAWEDLITMDLIAIAEELDPLVATIVLGRTQIDVINKTAKS